MLKRLLSSRRNLETTTDTSATTQRDQTQTSATQQNAFQDSPIRGHEPPSLLPIAEDAFEALNTDPHGFLKQNDITVRGKYGKGSGPMEFTIMSQGNNRGYTRRNSITGHREPVNEYLVQSKEDYEKRESAYGPHDAFHFTAQHLAMERLPTGPNLTTLDRPGNTHATVDPTKKQNFPTNALSGCAVVLDGDKLMHLRPAPRDGNDNGTFAGGDATEQAINQIRPSASVFGNSQYQDGTNYWIQNQGSSVHLHGQYTDNHGSDWRATITHDVLTPKSAMATMFSRANAKTELELRAGQKHINNNIMNRRGSPQNPNAARQHHDTNLQASLQNEIGTRQNKRAQQNRNALMASIVAAPRKTGFEQ